jgi:uncharacterized protein
MTITNVQVSDAPGARRYEAHVDGRLAGFAQYRLVGDEITFTHTEVKPDYEGRGVGGRLAKFALDDARTRGLGVQPACSFIRSWIERHPDYGDLVAD